MICVADFNIQPHSLKPSLKKTKNKSPRAPDLQLRIGCENSCLGQQRVVLSVSATLLLPSPPAIALIKKTIRICITMTPRALTTGAPFCHQKSNENITSPKPYFINSQLSHSGPGEKALT